MSLLKEIVVFLCGFLMFPLSAAQVIYPGKCPSNVKAMEGFKVEEYVGKWYENQKYFFLFEVGGKCITATYTAKSDGKITVVNKQINTLTGSPSQVEGEAVIVNSSEPSKLSVTFNNIPINIAAPYWVLDTDYKNYAVVWSCYEFGVFHTINAWILTRERSPSKAVLADAFKVVDKYAIKKSLFMITSQNDCPLEKK